MVYDPELKGLEEIGCVDPFDIMLGRKSQEEQGCWLGTFAARAFRQGHMAVMVGREVTPAVSEVFSKDGVAVIGPEKEQYIVRCLQEEMQGRHGQLTVAGDAVALPHAYGVEQALAVEIGRLSSADPFVKVSEVSIEEPVTDGQRAAVAACCTTVFCCVTGGPGSGKTYTAGVFLRALARASSVRPLHVAVTAPTGRAVQTLTSSIAAMAIEGVRIEAKTIHSLTAGREQAFLPYHLVIIDEGSMISSGLMLQLMQRLASGTRVVLLGDADQLPSVDPGQPFFECLQAAADTDIAHCSLHGCQRTGSKGLLTLAESVRRGDCRDVERVLKEREGDALFVECATKDDWQRAEELVDGEVLAGWRRPLSLEEARQLARKTGLLMPCRKGFWGSDSVNGRARWKGRFYPVVSTKNSYQLGVMNGDIGVLERTDPFDQIHFRSCTVPKVLMPGVEKAFAMTVHKSQGGEFEKVIVVLPPKAVVDRRLLYTAITRAKGTVMIVGGREDLMRAVEQKAERVSLLAGALRERCPTKNKRNLNAEFKIL